MRGGKLCYPLMEIYLFKQIVHNFVKLNPFTCVQLFDMALSRGFTTTHSFLMLNEDIGLLREAHFVMESKTDRLYFIDVNSETNSRPFDGGRWTDF